MEQFEDPTTFSDQSTESTGSKRIFLGLGSNQGERLNAIREAALRLDEKGMVIARSSSLYETEPVEIREQPDFINLSFEIETELGVSELLEACLSVEKAMGRTRSRPKGPRIIDIDILFYGQRILQSQGLSIPHPAFAQRKFVLVPMVEIAPEFKDPRSGFTMRELLHQCPDLSSVTMLKPFHWPLQI